MHSYIHTYISCIPKCEGTLVREAVKSLISGDIEKYLDIKKLGENMTPMFLESSVLNVFASGWRKVALFTLLINLLFEELWKILLLLLQRVQQS